MASTHIVHIIMILSGEVAAYVLLPHGAIDLMSATIVDGPPMIPSSMTASTMVAGPTDPTPMAGDTADGATVMVHLTGGITIIPGTIRGMLWKMEISAGAGECRAVQVTEGMLVPEEWKIRKDDGILGEEPIPEHRKTRYVGAEVMILTRVAFLLQGEQ